MKTKLIRLTSFIATLLALATGARAQGTAFTYQGRLTENGGPANDSSDFTFTLYDAASGGATVGVSNVVNDLAVTNGLFTVTLDFGAAAFSGSDRWLEIGVRPGTNTGAYTTLTPRQRITSTPYAIRAANLTGTLPLAQLPAGVLTNNSSGVLLSGVFTGNGAALSNVNATTLGGLGSDGFWKTNGNAGANPANGAFLGSTDNLPVEFRVNGVRALRLEPVGLGVISLISAPNVIGGWAGNQVANGAIGATVWGGGFGIVDDYGNIVGADFGTVSGGRQNSAGGAEATVAGGRANSASGGNATISGGYANGAGGNHATVAGGISNTTVSDSSTVSGGGQNTIQADSPDTTIGGGANNTIRSNSWRGTVGGGFVNTVGAPEGTVAGGAFNNALGFSSTISGGGGNAVSGAWSTIAGGRDNFLTNADYSSIGGGVQNRIETNAAFSTIGGGVLNVIRSDAARGTVGGGWANTVGLPEGTVAGGAFNSALGFSAVIGGGGGNTASGNWSTIAGGRANLLTNADYATVGGGVANTIQTNAYNAVIAGGHDNTIQSAAHSAIGGGGYNTIQLNAYDSVIGGGGYNSIQTNAYGSFIGGGGVNTIQPDASYSAIGAGYQNTIQSNSAYATIGGGGGNLIQAAGHFATVPGGRYNSATNYAFAAGNRAKANHSGAFVWGDATDADFSSTSDNQFSVRASGGVRLETGGAGMTLDGVNVLSGIVPSASLAGTYSSAVAFNNSGNSFTGNGANLTALNASQLTSGTVPDARLSANVSLLGSSISSSEITDGTIAPVDLNLPAFNTTFWRTAGNAGTTPGTHFLGTTDNQPLEFKVNGTRALRLEPTASTDTVNVIGGSAQNSVGVGLEGATIAGGGIGLFPNKITASYATISGGTSNNASGGWATIGGGRDNLASGSESTVPGGRLNIASGQYSTAMGAQTTASGFAATALGRFTVASNDDATAMGLGSIASGWDSTAMGTYTVAGGNYSFAAGYYAQATNQGSFVWADSTSVIPFASTANNQFLIRAGGGVGLGTPNPQGSLHIYSANNPAVMRLQSSAQPGAGRIEFVSDPQGSANEWRPGYIQSTDNGGFTGGLSFVVNGTGAGSKFGEVETMRVVNGRIGIGTNNPQSTLDVNGTARIDGANNWNVTAGEGDFRVGNDSYRFKIGVANGGGGAGDVWMRAHGGTARVFIKTPGGTTFFSNEGETAGVSLAAGGTAWAVVSDRNVKKDFAALDSVGILEKLAALPITQWHYKWETSDVTPHIGPMAQDFKAAFYPGADDKSITTQEADGVALAAIQGLNQKLEAEVKSKDVRIAELEKRLAAIEALLQK